jgi:hypothetical protein
MNTKEKCTCGLCVDMGLSKHPADVCKTCYGTNCECDGEGMSRPTPPPPNNVIQELFIPKHNTKLEGEPCHIFYVNFVTKIVDHKVVI